MQSNNQKAPKKLYQGVVLSDKMDKTIVVVHKRTYKDPLTEKVMRKIKKYKVHDENEQAKVNDVVEFYEGKPLSKHKYMYFYRIVRS